MIINKLIGFNPTTREPAFEGIRQKPKELLREFGKVTRERGFFKNKRLDIYNAYNEENKLVYKLYYLTDQVGNWLKSKLVYFDENGKKYKQITSEVG